MSAEPDFIIGSVKTSSNLDLMETFESLGIPCAYFDVTGFDDYLDMLNICTDITGRKDLYKANGLDVQQQIENAVKKADGSSPEVFTHIGFERNGKRKRRKRMRRNSFRSRMYKYSGRKRISLGKSEP